MCRRAVTRATVSAAPTRSVTAGIGWGSGRTGGVVADRRPSSGRRRWGGRRGAHRIDVCRLDGRRRIGGAGQRCVDDLGRVGRRLVGEASGDRRRARLGRDAGSPWRLERGGKPHRRGGSGGASAAASAAGRSRRTTRAGGSTATGTRPASALISRGQATCAATAQTISTWRRDRRIAGGSARQLGPSSSRWRYGQSRAAGAGPRTVGSADATGRAAGTRGRARPARLLVVHLLLHASSVLRTVAGGPARGGSLVPFAGCRRPKQGASVAGQRDFERHARTVRRPGSRGSRPSRWPCSCP